MSSIADATDLLKTANKRLKGILDSVNSIRRPEQFTVAFPPVPDPPHNLESLSASKSTATIPRGLTTIDFDGGYVESPDNRYEINGMLNKSNAKHIRTIRIFADDHLLWSIPYEGDAYRKNYNGYLAQMRNIELKDQRAHKLKLFAFLPTQFHIFATSTDNVTREQGVARSMERVLYDTSNDSSSVPVGTSWTPLPWTTEEGAIGGHVTPNPELHVMNLGPQSVVFANNGNNEVDIRAYVKNTLISHEGPDLASGYTLLDSWTTSSPQTINAGNKLSYDWSNLPYHNIKFEARVDPSASGTSSAVGGAMLATTT